MAKKIPKRDYDKMKVKIINETALINELSMIRTIMDIDPRKAKQQLTNLRTNIAKRIGKCFKIMENEI